MPFHYSAFKIKTLKNEFPQKNGEQFFKNWTT